jgi:hypothetical protein
MIDTAKKKATDSNQNNSSHFCTFTMMTTDTVQVFQTASPLFSEIKYLYLFIRRVTISLSHAVA